MARASRDKGARGEREVAHVWTDAGFPCHRTPNSGGLIIPGDIVGLDALHMEVKRQERWDVPAWLRQAHAEAPDDTLPVVCFRRNARVNDPCGLWHVALPLGAFVGLWSASRA